MEMIIGVTGRENYRVSVFGKDPDRSFECARYKTVDAAAVAVVCCLDKYKINRVTISAFDTEGDTTLAKKLISKIKRLGGFDKFAKSLKVRWFTDRNDPELYRKW